MRRGAWLIYVRLRGPDFLASCSMVDKRRSVEWRSNLRRPSPAPSLALSTSLSPAHAAAPLMILTSRVASGRGARAPHVQDGPGGRVDDAGCARGHLRPRPRRRGRFEWHRLESLPAVANHWLASADRLFALGLTPPHGSNGSRGRLSLAAGAAGGAATSKSTASSSMASSRPPSSRCAAPVGPHTPYIFAMCCSMWLELLRSRLQSALGSRARCAHAAAAASAARSRTQPHSRLARLGACAAV